ncbi:MAG: phospholipase [Tannerella sp.]|nr:phospholipase [Tannerella sp.]
MWYLVSGIIILGIVTAITGAFGNYRRRLAENSCTEKDDDADGSTAVPAECCGQHEVCERDSLLNAVNKKIEYYDDEELDVYRGTAPDEYKDPEIEAFREVLYTLRETEVSGWLHSLQLRNINLPEQLKDEALLIIEER